MIREEVENAQNIEKKIKFKDVLLLRYLTKKTYLWSKLINKIYLYYQKKYFHKF